MQSILRHLRINRSRRTAFAPTLLATVLCLLALLAPTAPTTVSAQSGTNDNPHTDQIIVQFDDTAEDTRGVAKQTKRIEALGRASGVALRYVRPMSGNAHVLRLARMLPTADVQAITDRLAQQPGVAYAEPDRIFQIGLTPNDTQLSSQWHFTGTNGIKLDAAWDVTTGSNIVVAAPDTGILLSHADLQGRFVQGYDFVSTTPRANDGGGRDNDPTDPGDWLTAAEINAPGSAFMGCQVRATSSWHGTHVIGTMAANSNNNTGVAGINWQARILPVRVMGKCGGTESDAADGIRWAAGEAVSGVPNNANPARIINLSIWAAGTCSTTYQNAINAAVNRGAVVVAIAGNGNADAGGFTPGNCNNVITVAAHDNAGNRASFSNFGAAVEISAPGVNVLSTHNNGATTAGADAYNNMSGTSQAAPHVAGVASLLLAVRPELNPAQVQQVIRYSAGAFPKNSTCANVCGDGMLDAYETVTGLYVSKGFGGGLGLPEQPYGTLGEAYNRAWNGARIHLRAESYNEPIVISKRVTLISVSGTTVIGR